jgi:transcriptional regulator PpsR
VSKIREPIARPARGKDKDAPPTRRRAFGAPRRTLEALDPLELGGLVESVSDLALVLDRRGVILDLSSHLEDLAQDTLDGWVGRAWLDLVSDDSRIKVADLLAQAASSGGALAEAPPPRALWRHVNHTITDGNDLPLLCNVRPIGVRGRVLVIGRDMRSQAELQRRLVDAQQAIERDYRRLRAVETRYHLLFERASDGVLIVDGINARIVEANAAAATILALSARRLVNAAFPVGLADRGLRDATAALARVRANGRSESLVVRRGDGQGDIGLTLTLFNQEDTPLVLVRLTAAAEERARGSSPAPVVGPLQQLFAQSPDGWVVTDPDGRVTHANPAFIELAQLGHEEHLRGASLDRWLGRPGIDLSVMLATLRQQGAVRLFATTLQGELGGRAEVEISAINLVDAGAPACAFTVRDVGRRLGSPTPAPRGTQRSVEQLTQLVGRMPLKDLVRESTDLIEQLCIEAALQLTQDNRASAAEMLGLSRQSLYVKLRRYGMGDLGGPAED